QGWKCFACCGALAVLLGAGGCSWFGGGNGNGGSKPLPMSATIGSNPGVDTRRGPPDDRPGPLMYDNARTDLMNPPQPPPPQRPGVGPVSDAVKQNVQSPSAEAS